jgi:hypothetical protein
MAGATPKYPIIGASGGGLDDGGAWPSQGLKDVA